MNTHFEAKALTLRIGPKTICETLNLQIKAGEIWGLLGVNGSGKTTLLHTFANLRKPTSGELLLFGNSLNSLSPKKIARHLGILMQDTHFIFPQTVKEFCLAGRYPHLNFLARESAEDLQITNESLNLMDLSSIKKQTIFTLSGGERRRLAIATLLTQAPSIYFLDEPTNHLDLRYQVKVLNHFKFLAENKLASVMMAVHDINLAQQFCHKILMLFGDGQILLGTTSEILTVENVSRLYRHELQHFMCAGKSIWLP